MSLTTQGKGVGKGNKGQGTARSQAKVYALTQQEAQESNTIVVGTLLTENLNAKILFDPRATHSFISVNLACKLSWPKEKLEQTLVVNTPLGKVLLGIDEVKKCEIKIGECTMELDLVVLEMEDYDVILGIDSLSKYHACVNYYHKVVTIQLEDGTSYIFQGEQVSCMSSFVSCAKVQRWLQKGHLAWIVAIGKKETNEVDIHEVLITKEFLDVFPE